MIAGVATTDFSTAVGAGAADGASSIPCHSLRRSAGAGLAAEERMAACLVELRECSDATKRVCDVVQAELDEFNLRDDRKL